MGRIYLLLLIVCPLWSRAQTPAYIHYGVRDGLPSNLVYCGAQDNNGFLWFGTDKGLACFDGLRFKVFGMKQGLPDPEVFCIKTDALDRMWLSCFRQKPCYYKQGRFITAESDSLLAKIDLKSVLCNFFEDKDKGIWITSIDYKVYYLSQTTAKLYQFANTVVRVEKVGNGFLILATSNILWMSEQGEIKSLYTFKKDPKNDISFQGVDISGNRLFYSFSDRSVLLEFGAGKIQEIATFYNSPGRVYTDHSGRFWVSSTLSGAICFDNTRRDLSNPVHYLPDKKITAMFEDQQGTMWFCSIDDGVFALPKSTPLVFTKGAALASNNITALAYSPKNTLLFGDDEGNLMSLDNRGIETYALGAGDGYNRVRQIVPLRDSNIFIVTDEGLFLKKPDGKVQKSPLANPKVIADQGDKIWFGSGRWIGYFHKNNLDTTNLIGRRQTALCNDGENVLWAGSVEGLFSQKDQFSTNCGIQFPALRGRIVTIQNAGPNKLWVVTPENGLLSVKVKEGAVIAIDTINNHLPYPIENIQSVFVDPSSGGKLWLATNRGLFGLTPQWDITHFDSHDGLADDDVNDVLVHQDTLWAGTVNGGLTRILLQPDDARKDFKTYITSLRYRRSDHQLDTSFIGNINTLKRINLPPDATLIELDLAGLDFRSRGNLHFECVQTEQLLPFLYWTPGNLFNWARKSFSGKKDTTQVQAASLNFGVRLLPGRYALQITAINTSGIHSRQPDYLTLVMHPRWYETVWFWLIVWSLLVLGIRRLYRSRIAFRELTASASELQLQALRAQINPHFIGNSINAIQQFFYPPDPARASEYISLFTRLLRQTMFFSERNFISLKEELAYDLDYLNMIHLRFGERFQFEINGTDQIPDDLPFPAMMLQPILENATLHGLAVEGTSYLHIDFSFSDKHIRCVVCDNGVGINESIRRKKEAGNERKSKGLELLGKKVQTINRLFNIELQLEFKDLSENGSGKNGTCVTLSYSPENIVVP